MGPALVLSLNPPQDLTSCKAGMKDGGTPTIDYLMTRVYEKIDGRWLIVSHHVPPKPQ
jgi:hypothetical protein